MVCVPISRIASLSNVRGTKHVSAEPKVPDPPPPPPPRHPYPVSNFPHSTSRRYPGTWLSRGRAESCRRCRRNQLDQRVRSYAIRPPAEPFSCHVLYVACTPSSQDVCLHTCTHTYTRTHRRHTTPDTQTRTHTYPSIIATASWDTTHPFAPLPPSSLLLPRSGDASASIRGEDEVAW